MSGVSRVILSSRDPDALRRASVAAQSWDPESLGVRCHMGPGSAAHHFVLRSVRGTRPLCNDKHGFASSRLISPELCLVASPSFERGRREGREPAGTRGPLCELTVRKRAQRHTGEARTSRPSLRSGLTAYVGVSTARLSRTLAVAEFRDHVAAGDRMKLKRVHVVVGQDVIAEPFVVRSNHMAGR